MAGIGPMPTPTATLKQRGSWRAETRKGEPQFTRGCPVPPKSLTGEALAEWNRITAELDHAGLLTTADRSELAAYCDAWADFTQAVEQAKKAVKKVGYLKAIGVLRYKQTARESLLKAADRFGLNPAVRTRIKVNDEGTETPTLKAFKLNS